MWNLNYLDHLRLIFLRSLLQDRLLRHGRFCVSPLESFGLLLVVLYFLLERFRFLLIKWAFSASPWAKSLISLCFQQLNPRDPPIRLLSFDCFLTILSFHQGHIRRPLRAKPLCQSHFRYFFAFFVQSRQAFFSWSEVLGKVLVQRRVVVSPSDCFLLSF